jgi:hypothetical protein
MVQGGGGRGARTLTTTRMSTCNYQGEVYKPWNANKNQPHPYCSRRLTWQQLPFHNLRYCRSSAYTKGCRRPPQAPFTPC